MFSDERVSVVLVAENRLLREALAKLISASEQLELRGAFPLSGNTTSQILQDSPDVVVLDFGGNPVLPLQFLTELRGSTRPLRSVAIGVDSERDLFWRTIGMGILGYLEKDASAADVISAIKIVAAGGAICSPPLCAELFALVRQQENLTHVSCKVGLTRREHQLLPLIEKGMTNKEIASQLNLSEQTVKNHIHNMLRKGGKSDRLDLTGLCNCGRKFHSPASLTSAIN